MSWSSRRSSMTNRCGDWTKRAKGVVLGLTRREPSGHPGCYAEQFKDVYTLNPAAEMDAEDDLATDDPWTSARVTDSYH